MIEIVLFTVKKKLLLNCEEITKTSRKYVYTFLAPTGAQGEAMSCVRPCVCACVTLFNRTLKMS